jgi:hypothetical protein
MKQRERRQANPGAAPNRATRRSAVSARRGSIRSSRNPSPALGRSVSGLPFTTGQALRKRGRERRTREGRSHDQGSKPRVGTRVRARDGAKRDTVTATTSRYMFRPCCRSHIVGRCVAPDAVTRARLTLPWLILRTSCCDAPGAAIASSSDPRQSCVRHAAAMAGVPVQHGVHRGR